MILPAPEGRHPQGVRAQPIGMSPLRGWAHLKSRLLGLTPQATLFRPSGAENRDPDSQSQLQLRPCERRLPAGIAGEIGLKGVANQR